MTLLLEALKVLLYLCAALGALSLVLIWIVWKDLTSMK
jgi:hypothetical protein